MSNLEKRLKALEHLRGDQDDDAEARARAEQLIAKMQARHHPQEGVSTNNSEQRISEFRAVLAEARRQEREAAGKYHGRP